MEQERLKKRLEMLEQRIGSLDPAVSALVDHVMSRPAAIRVACPKCGNVVQIMLISGVRSTSKDQALP